MTTKKIIISILMMIFSLVITFQLSYGFFDKLFSNEHESILIGTWTRLDDPATPETVLDALNDLSMIIDPQPTPEYEQIDIIEYIYELLFETDDEGNVDFTTLNELYEGYTIQEVIDTALLIRDFTESFLIIDEQTGQPVFPDYTTVSPFPVNIDQTLLPGDSIQMNRIVQTANHANAPSSDWSPITLLVSIESPNGEDISDYAIEILFDRNPFSINNPFSYNYLYRDETSWNIYRASGGVTARNNVLTSITSSTIFNTTVFKNINNSYISTNFQHNFEKPTYSGDWSRLPTGPNMFLAAPEGSKIGAQQQFNQFNNPKVRPGLILMGKANGTKSEIKIDIPFRTPRDGQSAPVLPFIIVVSRGLQLGSNGIPLSNQSKTIVNPIIRMMVIEGQVWTE